MFDSLGDVVVKNKMNALKDSLLRKSWLPIESDDNGNDKFTLTMGANKNNLEKIARKTCDLPKDQVDYITKESLCHGLQ